MNVRLAAGLLLAGLSASALAERPVYRSVDANGNVVYTDRPATASAPRVKMWTPASPSALQYDAARTQAEADRVYYERLRAEDGQPRPIVIINPSSSGSAVIRPSDQRYAPPYPSFRAGRWDPNLPDSQPPSLERRYHYDGR